MKIESQRELDCLDERIVLAERRRQRVFRRWVLGVVGCLTVLVAVRLGWGLHAGRLLAVEIERIRAAGEPILVSDFGSVTAIPDSENAAVAYQRASAAIVEPVNSVLSIDDFRGDMRVFDAYPNEARAILISNEESLRRLREGRSRDLVDWGVRFESPMIAVMLPHLRPNRELSQFASTAAFIQFRDGDHFAAIETIRDIQGLAAGIMATRPTTMITHRVAGACERHGIDVLEEITSRLSVVGTSTNQQSVVLSAKRSQVQALIHELRDEEVAWWSLRYSTYYERAVLLDTMQAFLASELDMLELLEAGERWKPLFGPFREWMRPAFELDAAFMLRMSSLIGDSASERNWPSAVRILRRTRHPHRQQRESTMVEDARYIVSVLLFYFSEWSILYPMPSICMRRMAAIALAVRLYELDRGHRPDALGDLAPDYIDVIPVDPFAADGRLLGYRPNADPPVIYSVGVDGIDDDGAFMVRNDGSVVWDEEDIVYFLNGDRPRERLAAPTGDLASEQAEEDDGEK